MAQETVIERARDTDELAEDMEPPSAFASMLPKMMKMVPPLMMMGLLILLTGLGLGIYGADLVGDAIGQGVAGEGADEFRDAQTLQAWLPSFEFLGMGLILFSISITLLGIATGLRKMVQNVVGLIIEHETVER